MRIGVDIDGVLINSTDMWIEAGLNFAKEKNILVSVNKNKFLPIDIFSWNEKIDDEFWMRFYEDYFRFSLPVKDCIKALQKLKEEGHEVYIITARGVRKIEKEIIGVDVIQNMTKEWLTKNEIPYDKIIFSDNYSKSKLCLENNVDVMIDDSSENVFDLSKVMPVINFARSYNEDVKNYEDANYKIFRTDNWNLIYTIINYRLQK